MNTEVKFLRRLGPSPRSAARAEQACHYTYACPDIFELADGDFAIIGADMTQEAGKLPSDAGCASHERIVRVPRYLLIRAKRDIPENL
jgi:hypothetical protein